MRGTARRRPRSGRRRRANSPVGAFLTEVEARFEDEAEIDVDPSGTLRKKHAETLATIVGEGAPRVLQQSHARSRSPSPSPSPPVSRGVHPLVSETNFDMGKKTRIAEKLAIIDEPPQVNVGGGLAGIVSEVGKRMSSATVFAARGSQSKRNTAKLPVLMKYAPGQFEAEADDVQAAVADTFQSISKFDPTDLNNSGGAKKRNNDEVYEDPEEEALKRRLYRYKYVRRIDDKLPTIDQLREKVEQMEEDAILSEDDDRFFERRGAVHPRKTPAAFKQANQLRQTFSDFRSSDEGRTTATSWVERNAEARRRVDEDYLSRYRAVQKSKARKSAQLQRHNDDVATAARQPSMAEVRKILAMHWFVYSGVVHFLQRARETLSYSRMSKKELIELVKKGRAPDHLGDNREIRFAKDITRLERNLNTKNREMEMLVVLQLASKFKGNIRKRRSAAQCVYDCINAWASAGRLVMTVRAFHIKTRKLQAFWRQSREKMANAVGEIERRWAKIEEEMVTEIVKEERRGGGPNKKENRKKKQAMSVARLTMTDFIAVRMTQKNVVRDFIMSELRVNRFNFIAQRESWEILYEHYLEEVRDWREDKTARALIGLAPLKNPPPELPAYPTARPTDAELTVWIKRCRKDPSATRPMPISKFVAGAGRRKAMEKPEVEVRKAGAVLMSARDHLPRIPFQVRQTGMLIAAEERT